MYYRKGIWRSQEKVLRSKDGNESEKHERAAELVQCAVILHNICILFSDNGADLLDDEDLDIVDDELDIDHGEEHSGQMAAAAAAFPLSVRKDDVNNSSKLQLFQYRQNKNSQMTKYTPFFREVISFIEVPNN